MPIARSAGHAIMTRRLIAQRLIGPDRWDQPGDAVSSLLAIQSQDFAPAKWGVGERTAGATDASVQAAFDAGEILRTHVLRPTWHFVTPADIRWLLALTGPRVQAQNAFMYRQNELDSALLRRCNGLLEGWLRDRQYRTRAQIEGLLEREDIATKGFRTAYILMNAELESLICSGPMAGKQHTYALISERAPAAAVPLHLDDALRQLALRYFAHRGPATAKDLHWWSSLPLAQVERAIVLAGDSLHVEHIDGVSYWSAHGTASGPAPGPVAHILQPYDDAFISYSETRYLCDLADRRNSLPPKQSIYNGVVLIDGQLAGHWKRTTSRRDIQLYIALYRELPSSHQTALERAARSHGRFIGLPATLHTSLLPASD